MFHVSLLKLAGGLRGEQEMGSYSCAPFLLLVDGQEEYQYLVDWEGCVDYPEAHLPGTDFIASWN